jgi:hypothetical protein
MNAWAARIGRNALRALGDLRQRGDVLVLADSQHIWLRGPDADESLDLALRCLPGAERFTVLDDGQLVPHGHRVPRGRLPVGEWRTLAEWLVVELPQAALPGAAPSAIPLKMVRSDVAAEANVLLATLDDWLHYAETAAEVRLAPLTFAADQRRRVVIRGAPLPPVRGRRYVESQGVAVEGGWTWSPALDAAVLRRAMKLEKDDLALLHRDGTWQRLGGEDFVRATRSAARLTKEAIGDA